jgi:hypothetical protein
MPVENHSHSLLLQAGLFWGLALVLGALAWTDLMTVEVLLISAVAFSLIWPMTRRALHKRLDCFEPIVLGNLSLAAMFVARPIYDLVSGRLIHAGYSIAPTFNEALWIALIGSVMLQIGYFAPAGSWLANRLPRPPSFRPGLAELSAWAYVLLGAGLFGIFLEKNGGMRLLLLFFHGRHHFFNDLFLNSTGYLYNGILMWGAAALIFFALSMIKRGYRFPICFGLTSAFFLFFYAAQGTRSNLLPLVMALPVFWYLRHHRRPRAATLLIAALLGAAVLGWLRDVRTPGTDPQTTHRLVSALSSPIREASNILAGPDTEMFDSLANALLVVPERVPFNHGGTATDVLIRAVPRPLWPNKPLESNDALVQALWPAHYSASRASPAFSILGPLYADSGLPSVAAGMICIGCLLSTFWHWLQRYGRQPVAQLIYAMALPFVIILMRGSIPDTLSRMLFLVCPLVLLMLLMRLRFRFLPRLRAGLFRHSQS